MSAEPDNAASPDLVERLVQLDEELAGRKAAAGSTAAPDETVPHDLADAAACLEVFERVREQAPGAVDDLLHEEPFELSWLETEDGQPQRLGRFAIERRLGSGGFGVVFLARDPDLNREVALKVPRVEALVSDDLQRRFLHEARAAASLSHANIAAVYEVGRAGPICYISSAVCFGGTLRELLEQTGGRLPPRSAAMLVSALAEAVQHAHSRGILHRDIKPGNVLLDLEPGVEADVALASNAQQLASVARLVDFGLARDLASAEQNTRTGVPLGTPAYMAPEQAAGVREQVGLGADVYALGATLYHLLTGQPPIKKESDVQTLQAVATDQPKSSRRLNPLVPADLDAICLKCLAKKPEQRYASASALADDLQRFLDGVSVRARPVNSVTRLTRWCRRNPALAAALGALLAVLTTGVATSSTLWLQADAARHDAESKKTLADEQAAEALKQARLARNAVDRLLTGIAEEPNLKSDGMEPFRQRLLGAASEFYDQIRQDRPRDPEVVSEYIETLERLATIHRKLDDHHQALALWEEAAEHVASFFPDDRTRLTRLLGSQAQEFQALGQYADATRMSREAVNVQRESGTALNMEVQRGLIRLLVQEAQTALSIGDVLQAKQSIDEAVNLGQELTGKPLMEWPNEKLWGHVLKCKARVHVRLQEYGQAEQTAHQALYLFEQLLQQHPHDRSACLMHMASLRKTLGTLHSMLENYEAAEREYNIERKLAEELVQRHPDVGMLVDYLVEHSFRLAQVIAKLDRAVEAQTLLEANLSRIEAGRQQAPEIAHSFDLHEANSRHILSQLHQEAGRLADARIELKAAIELCEALLAADDTNPNAAVTLETLNREFEALSSEE